MFKQAQSESIKKKTEVETYTTYNTEENGFRSNNSMSIFVIL